MRQGYPLKNQGPPIHQGMHAGAQNGPQMQGLFAWLVYTHMKPLQFITLFCRRIIKGS